MIEWISRLNPEDMEEIKYSSHKNEVKLLDWESSRFSTMPICNQTQLNLYEKSYNPCK